MMDNVVYFYTLLGVDRAIVLMMPVFFWTFWIWKLIAVCLMMRKIVVRLNLAALFGFRLVNMCVCMRMPWLFTMHFLTIASSTKHTHRIGEIHFTLRFIKAIDLLFCLRLKLFLQQRIFKAHIGIIL